MTSLSVSEEEQFYRYLVDLCRIPSVYTSPKDVENAILFCERVLRENLRNYFIIRDGFNNLICMPHEIDNSINMLYLSAHVDTVDAKPEEWSSPFSPFIPFEDERQIVARGVSDCKAGVSFQLFLSSLLKQGLVKLRNIVFTLTFKEEGPGIKTSTEIAKELGKKYPLSDFGDYILVLENTVSVSPEPTLQYYTSERGNFVIDITGKIRELQQRLVQLNNWNPVFITPLHKDVESVEHQMIAQPGGHACTVGRESNLLTAIILSATSKTTIQSLGKMDAAVIPTKIRVGSSKEEVVHSMILNNRSFVSRAAIDQELDGISYTPLSSFGISSGMDVQRPFQSSPMALLLQKLDGKFLKVQESFNPGASDASIIYSSMDSEEQKKILPIVIGPGTRSQKHLSPPRLTHGSNETFDKSSGIKAIQTLLDLIRLTGHLGSPSAI